MATDELFFVMRGCRLVSHDILRLVHAGANMVYVGKEAGLHTRSQDEIHALLCQFAEKGSTVLRLKGGDPFIFGRGGEEAEYLRQRGIAVHCVPGNESRTAQLASTTCNIGGDCDHKMAG
jgi:siroheme synthase